MIPWLDDLAEPWGGRRSLLRVWRARARGACGGFGALRRVQWCRISRIVFVCKGNICRSPYAEFRARGLGLAAASCGLRASTGVAADPAARAVAQSRGIDLARARATPAATMRFGSGDLLLFMEPSQLQEFDRVWVGTASVQISLLGLWSRPRTPHIPDPYGGRPHQFEACFDVIDSAIDELARHVASDHHQSTSPS